MNVVAETGSGALSIAVSIGLVCVLGTSATAAAPDIPQWRGEVAGTDYLGPDVLWRPREWLIFHMYDEQGTGFDLTVTSRDMNTYLQGKRPVMVWVVGPVGNTLVRQIEPDDGITSGNEQYRDGIYDVFADYRYREWHRVHSPGGTPPTKKRSPYLKHPASLRPRTFTYNVPAAGPGLYRVIIVASWDHWLSVTPSRPLPTGVHPGPGPLYLHGDVMDDSYLYVPPTTRDVAIATSEEIQPYNWAVRVEDLDGGIIGETDPETFYNYLVLETDGQENLWKIRTRGDTTGACLHIRGLPPVLCPDPETARIIHGGCEVDEKGRMTFHECTRTLNRWADGLTEDDLRIPPKTVDPTACANPELTEGFRHFRDVLKTQDINPHSDTFGQLLEDFPRGVGIDTLALAAGTEDPANPYYSNKAIIRRVLLNRLQNLRRQAPYYWYDTGRDFPLDIEVDPNNIGSVVMRSNWYSLGTDSRHVSSANLLKEVMDPALPAEVVDAWKQSFNLWVGGRWNMHCGDTTNQWTYNLRHVLNCWRFTGMPEIKDMLARQSERLATPGSLGRTNPDGTPYSHKSSLGYTYACDIGRVGAGYCADGWGWDNEYTIEQVSNMGHVWQEVPVPMVVDWWNTHFYLKTHLTLPREGVYTTNYFGETCSPTDLNFRTRYYTHKSGLPTEARDMVVYGDLWRDADENPRRTYPCLEDEPFVRVIDNMYYFINAPGYYTISYGAYTSPDWTGWRMADVADGHAELVGYAGMGYDGYQREATKIGGLSAVYVRGCGPTILSSNSDVWYSNVIWGRRHDPICPKWAENVDPTIICSGFNDPTTSFDREGRVMVKSGDFRYAPLHWSRMMRFRDDRIVVTLELTATDDLDLQELYEAIPYFADNRLIRAYDESLAEEMVLQEPERIEGDVSMEPVTFRAVDFAAENGAGSTVIFDDEYTFTQTEPLRYRSAASATRSFNLPLPAQMAAGDSHALRYVIFSHNRVVTANEIRRVAQEEGL